MNQKEKVSSIINEPLGMLLLLS